MVIIGALADTLADTLADIDADVDVNRVETDTAAADAESACLSD